MNFILKRMKKTSAVESTTDLMVETQLCKLRVVHWCFIYDTSKYGLFLSLFLFVFLFCFCFLFLFLFLFISYFSLPMYFCC